MGKIVVKVRKAGIELKAGETLNDFTRELGVESRNHVLDKLNLPSESSGGYLDEVFSNYAVIIVWSDGVDYESNYYAVSYERKDDGEFEFGDIIEVERKTVFVQSNPLEGVTKSVQKKICGDWVKKELWGGIL